MAKPNPISLRLSEKILGLIKEIEIESGMGRSMVVEQAVRNYAGVWIPASVVKRIMNPKNKSEKVS